LKYGIEYKGSKEKASRKRTPLSSVFQQETLGCNEQGPSGEGFRIFIESEKCGWVHLHGGNMLSFFPISTGSYRFLGKKLLHAVVMQ